MGAVALAAARGRTRRSSRLGRLSHALLDAGSAIRATTWNEKLRSAVPRYPLDLNHPFSPEQVDGQFDLMCAIEIMLLATIAISQVLTNVAYTPPADIERNQLLLFTYGWTLLSMNIVQAKLDSVIHRYKRSSHTVSVDDVSVRLQDAPKLPRGYSYGAPDFVGIGAQRCGTSTWYSLIADHPGIFHPRHFSGQVAPPYLIKERHFLDRFFDRPYRQEEIESYHRWFPRPTGKRTGEWTPRYLLEHWAPLTLNRLAPDAKLLVVLRDPVERFISGMNFQLRFVRKLEGTHAHGQFLRGCYGLQLANWLKHFSKDSLLVLQFELCIKDTAAQLNKTYEFLSLDRYLPSRAVLERKRNPTKDASFQLTADHKASLVDAYSEDVWALCRLCPEIDIGLWPNFAKRANPGPN